MLPMALLILSALSLAQPSFVVLQAMHLGASFFVVHKTNFSHDGQVLGNIGNIGTDHVGQLADASIQPPQFIDNEQPAWMPQGLHDFGPWFIANPSLLFGIIANNSDLSMPNLRRKICLLAGLTMAEINGAPLLSFHE